MSQTEENVIITCVFLTKSLDASLDACIAAKTLYVNVKVWLDRYGCKYWTPSPVAIWCPIAPPCGRLSSEMDCLGTSYTHTQQQQMGLTTLEQQDYDMDPFRQGLTPPQMPGDHMHPYGKHLQLKWNG